MKGQVRKMRLVDIKRIGFLGRWWSGLVLFTALLGAGASFAPTASGVVGQRNSQNSAEKKALSPQEAQRQQELADDTAKLLNLANELKAELDKSSKDTLSLTVVKKAEEVEKLAHKVKEEMKKTMAE